MSQVLQGRLSGLDRMALVTSGRQDLAYQVGLGTIAIQDDDSHWSQFTPKKLSKQKRA
ncbi:hypothetical protein GCM10027343_43370 [Noviherbaspirillum agri]